MHADVGFYLDGALHSNNSVVSLSVIGENFAALYCLTNLTACCTEDDGGMAGEWILPSDSADFTTSRVPSAVLLNRRNNALGPTGIFTCRIPDGNNQLSTLYIGVDTGSYIVM